MNFSKRHDRASSDRGAVHRCTGERRDLLPSARWQDALAAAAALASFAIAPPALAGQMSGNVSDGTPQAVSVAASADGVYDPGKTLQLVTVTGSRIPQVSGTAAQPLVSISKAQLLATGQPTLAGALQELPSVGASSSNEQFFGTGEETINLRNLGADRVLVLVNGHRWVTGLDGYTDLSTIPTAVVKRVEVLQDGASAVYGSSAIAGVVNIITVQDFNGVEASAYYGIHNGDGHWDGHEQNYSLTVGADREKWGAVFNIGFDQEGNIPDTNRGISSEPVYGTGRYFGNAFTPQGQFEFYVPAAYTTNPTSPANVPNPALTGLTSAQCPTVAHGGQYLPYCDLTLIPGTPGTSASDYAPWNRKTDSFSSTAYNNILLPYRKYSIYGQGYYRFNSQVRFHSVVLFDSRESNGSLGPQPLNIQPSTINADIAATNPYNPFGIPLDASGDAGTNVVTIERALAEAGARIEERHVYTYYVDGGFDGSFNLVGRDFIWNSDYIYSRQDEFNQAPNILATNFLLQQLDGDLSQCTKSCVPMNVFGGQYGGGSITPAMLAHSEVVTGGSITNTDQAVDFNVASPNLVKLPGGWVGFAAGYEYMKKTGVFIADPLLAHSEISGYSSSPSTSGGYNIGAYYAELKIPLLANMPFVRKLNADVATRHSQYSTFGGNTSNQLGVQWSPVSDLLVRSTLSQGFRSPTINDLYSGESTSFTNVLDPCDASNPDRPQSCLSGIAGIPGVPQSYQQGGSQILTTTGSNPKLQPETSLSRTLGFVYDPSQVPNLDVTADYWQIKVRRLIGSVTAQELINGCYLEMDATLCNNMSRNSSGAVSSLLAELVNVGDLTTEGVDLGLRYTLPAFRIGRFSVAVDATHTNEYRLTGANVANAQGTQTQEESGWFEYPKWKANLALQWALGPWSATWQMLYIGRQLDDCSMMTQNGFGYLCNDQQKDTMSPAGIAVPTYILPATTFHDLTVSFHSSPLHATASLGINNVFNTQDPVVFRSFYGNFDAQQYPVPGRYYYVRLTAKF